MNIYPTDYETAISITLSKEGGYVNNPNDSGGETNMGVTFAALADYNKKHGTDWTIPTLDRDQAKEFYFDVYWVPMRLHELGNQQLKNVLLAQGINMGSSEAVKLLQRALNTHDDGLMGPNTLALANHIEPILLISEYCDRVLSFYNDLVTKRPKDSIFLAGWKNRINSFRVA